MSEIERDIDHEAIRAELRILLIQMDANFEVMNNTLQQILEQAKKTNGRVSLLENDTDMIRFIKKYKWSAAVIAVGFVFFFKEIDVIKWISNLL